MYAIHGEENRGNRKFDTAPEILVRAETWYRLSAQLTVAKIFFRLTRRDKKRDWLGRTISQLFGGTMNSNWEIACRIRLSPG